MAHAWNACWVNALGGSNPPSSADGKPLRSAQVVIEGAFFMLDSSRAARQALSCRESMCERSDVIHAVIGCDESGEDERSLYRYRVLHEQHDTPRRRPRPPPRRARRAGRPRRTRPRSRASRRRTSGSAASRCTVSAHLNLPPSGLRLMLVVCIQSALRLRPTDSSEFSLAPPLLRH